MSEQKASPLFKYIGGKSWLKEHLSVELTRLLKENTVTTYVEPFAGGLGAFLSIYDVLLNNGIKTVVLNDINTKLIQFYKQVNTDAESLVKAYMELENNYAKTIPEDFCYANKKIDKSIVKENLKEAALFYNQVRNQFNQETDILMNSVYLLFLQSHCFNGVYRENSKGHYNTPYNWEPRLVTENKIRDKIKAVVSVFSQFEMIFSNKSYHEMDYSLNALYYLDPPYINEVEVVENKYHKESFNLNSQKDLIQRMKNKLFVYSNHDNPVLIHEFDGCHIDYVVKRIPRKNIISASNESRKTDKIEILVSTK